MNKKLLSLLLVIVMIVSAVPFCVSAGYLEDHANTTFSVSKASYNAGETVTFNFENAIKDDWIAIYKDGYTPASGVSYIAWAYVTGTGSIDYSGGTGWTVESVSKDYTKLNEIPGSYTATLYYYGSGNPVSSVKFDIVSDTSELALDKESFYNDEAVSVRLVGCKNDNDWVGLYKKGNEKTAYLDYIYYSKCVTERATFPSGQNSRYHYDDSTNPGILAPGEYEFILYKNDTYTELDRKSFTVIDRKDSTDPYFTFEKDHYNNTTPITVRLYNCKNAKDWVAIYAASGGSYLEYIYNKDSIDGVCTFKCYNPGNYTMVLYEDDHYNVLYKRNFTIEELTDICSGATRYEDVTADNVKDSFFVDGVQIRLFDETSGTEQGMRFVASLGKNVLANFGALNDANVQPTDAADTGIGFGFLVSPADKVGDGELTKDNAKITVPAVKTYEETDDALLYTVCLLGIDAEHWTSPITVRPYITYKDASDNEHTVYGDAYTKSVYESVEYGIENDPANAEALTALKQAYEAEIAGN